MAKLSVLGRYVFVVALIGSAIRFEMQLNTRITIPTGAGEDI
jgi:hypothetical protein